MFTGLMVRNLVDMEEDRKENLILLELSVNIRAPVFRISTTFLWKRQKEMILKNFNSCRQLFETYKRQGI